MKKKLKINKLSTVFRSKYTIVLISIISGIFIGWLMFHTSSTETSEHNHETETEEQTIWTCSMHPQIKMNEPGKCPLCGMDLIPLNQSKGNIDPDAIHLSDQAIALANVQTSKVSKHKQVKKIQLFGKVQADERSQQMEVAHFSGRVEKLMINFTGEQIQKGQLIAQIYSPALITAQQELLETAKDKKSFPGIYEAAKEKLRQWKLTEKQISSIESGGTPLSNIEIFANTSGIVVSKKVNSGDYIEAGMPLYEVIDLSHVWILFDVYESELAYLKKGDNITFTIKAFEGETFNAKISYIDPVVDAMTRVSKVRVEINNPDGKLKPEMFATGIAETKLIGFEDKISVPKTAVLWTGKRSIVYVRQAGLKEAVFKLREIELGPSIGDQYIILKGLSDNEEIVTQGAFSIDAAAQLEGKPSMMSMSESKEETITKTSDEHITSQAQKPTLKIQKKEFAVSGNCDMCKEKIESTAKENGSKTAIWDAETKKLTIEYLENETSPNKILKAIAKQGYDSEKFKADNSSYDNLPECCKYRK